MTFKNLIFSLLLLCSFNLAGQGVVTGVLTDESSGETLIAAYIYVEGTEIIETTDFDGKYSISLDPGVYTLRGTYIGFADKIIADITVKEGETTFMDFIMSSDTEQLEEVVISAKSIDRTENALMVLQKKSYKIQDGISAQEMSRLSSGTAATAMTKITGASVQEGKYVNVRGLGDRYSVTQLNGLILPSVDPYRNSAQLDLIPSNLLENIVASKTFTPDQPGTFTGGNIEIKTKSFPERQTFSVSVSTGYNAQNNLRDDFITQEGGDKDWLGYDDGTRDLPAILKDPLASEYLNKDAEFLARFGNLEAATYADQAAKSMSYNFDRTFKNSGIDYGVSLSYGNSFDLGGDRRIGVIFATNHSRDFEHRDNFRRANWLLFDKDSGILQNRGDYRVTTSKELPVLNGFGGLSFQLDNNNTIEYKAIYNHNAAKGSRYIYGEDGNNIEAPSFKIGRGHTFEATTMMNHQISGRHLLNGLNKIEIEWTGGMVNAERIEPNSRFLTSQYNSETGSEGIPLANVNDPFYFWRTLTDEVKNAKVDITIPLNIGKSKANKLKFGGYISEKDRDFDENRYIIQSASKAESFNGDFDAFFAEDNIGLVETQELSNGNLRYHLGNFINDATLPKNSYTGYEDVRAFYGMAILNPVDKIKLVGGVRVEETDIFVQSKSLITVEGTTPDSTNTSTISASDILPSVNLIYSLSENMNLRAGYNKTIARPNLREVAPFASFDVLTDEFLLGNPELTTTNITNYDVRWEWFVNPGEIFAVSSFYKDFTNPITLRLKQSSNIERQYVNVASGNVFGIELEFRKNLSFLSSKLQGFKLGANVAFIESSTDLGEDNNELLVITDRPFEGQAPILANLTLTYDNQEAGWSSALSYNYKGDNLTTIGDLGTDIYVRAYNTLDFVISKNIGDHTSIRLGAKNLLNPYYTESTMYEGQEYIYSQFKRGTSYSLSVNYKL